MNKLGLTFEHDDTLRISIEDSTTGVTITLAGSMESQYPDKMYGPFFRDLHQRIQTCALSVVDVDLCDLTFLNSSGIKLLINWVITNQQQSKELRYTIRFIINETHKWQSSSLTMLKMIAKDTVQVTVK